MPLSAPAARSAQHIRKFETAGYAREDGLYDIEGHISDEKTYAFENRWRGVVEPGEKLHDMSLRLTLTDEMEIVAVEASTDASPFAMCGNITGAYEKLVGLKIAPGFTREAAKRIGGVQGCTHITELLRVLGTVAFQTMWPVVAAKAKAVYDDGTPKRPALLNTCHAYADTSPVVQQFWPEEYKGSAAEDSHGG